jgi:hypothetical protein
MKRFGFLLSLLVSTAIAGEAVNNDVQDVQKRLDFVANIQKFQGMYDSVVAFCGDKVPATILDRSKAEWLSINQPYLDLRDKELARVIEIATSNNAPPENISKIRSWVEDQYESRLHNDRLYKDLPSKGDLTIPCSRRLGEMVSEDMSLKALSPESVEYFDSSKNEP